MSEEESDVQTARHMELERFFCFFSIFFYFRIEKMNRKGLALLMRTRIQKPSSSPSGPNSSCLSLPTTAINEVNRMASNSEAKTLDDKYCQQRGLDGGTTVSSTDKLKYSSKIERGFDIVREAMRSAILMNKTGVLDSVLDNFSEGYYCLSHDDRRNLLLILAKGYDLNRSHVRELMKQYIGLEHSNDHGGQDGVDEEALLSAYYRIERNLKHALKPNYEILFERLNTHPGGLKFLSDLRADILSIIMGENIAALRALDSYLKEKIVTWLSPASLELHHITWDDPASLLEKIVAHEAVHPISSLLDLKRRLGVGRRCFGYLHPSIPGEPLIFIEVALVNNVVQTIQDVLWDVPPIPEYDATCALFYSISSTQPGLAGVDLGKFLIKRVIEEVKRDMPHISVFATISPIPGFMNWLLSKLASQSKLAQGESLDKESVGSAFRENILLPEEERELLSAVGESAAGKSGMEVMWNLVKSIEWIQSDKLVSALKAPLMRLCARYLLQEKKRGKALDPVANFHLRNGAMMERLNWMADRSEKRLKESGGIMVNYVYRLDGIDENARAYFSTRHISASPALLCFIQNGGRWS